MKKPRPASDPAEKTLFDWPGDAGVVGEVLSRIDRKVKRRQRRRRAALLAAGAAGAFALGLFAAESSRTGAYATQSAERKVVLLPDGSRAELNAVTRLRTDFRWGRRRLRLDGGEAFFSVRKDAAHPFLVATPAGTVRVTGTKFDVRIGADLRPSVTLLEGSVRFEAEGRADLRLLPGQQLAFSGAGAAIRTLSAASLDGATAWRSGRMVLDDVNLAGAAAGLARYFGCAITVDPAIADLRPGGTVPLADLDAALEALEESLPIRLERRADGSRRIHPK